MSVQRLVCLFLTPKGVGGSAGVNMSLGKGWEVDKGDRGPAAHRRVW